MRSAAALAALLAAAPAAVVVAQQPEMAHLSLTGKPGEMAVDFASHPRDGVAPSSYGCLLGTTPSPKQFFQAYNFTNFTAQDEAFGGQTFLHQVLFTGLSAGSQYYYVCGSEATKDPWSRVYEFTYTPAAARYAVIADAGYYNFESLGDLIAAAEGGDFDVLIHSGDFAYNLEDEKGGVGDGYMRLLEPVISKVPYMGTVGNHESMGGTFAAYAARFQAVADNAGANSGSGSNMYYSVDVGLVHWVFWNSEIFWTQGAPQQAAMLAWLKADLAAANANRAAVPWVISSAHKTWAMDDTLKPPTGAGAVVWELLTAGGVDLYLTGHIHQYNRFLPLYPNAANGTGVVDRACATAGGNATNPTGVYSDPAYMATIISAAPGDQEVNRPAPAVDANDRSIHAVGDIGEVTSSNNYGFGSLTIVNATHLHWTWATSVPHVNSTAPNYSDDLWLIQHNHGPRSNLPPM